MNLPNLILISSIATSNHKYSEANFYQSLKIITEYAWTFIIKVDILVKEKSGTSAYARRNGDCRNATFRVSLKSQGMQASSKNTRPNTEWYKSAQNWK